LRKKKTPRRPHGDTKRHYDATKKFVVTVALETQIIMTHKAQRSKLTLTRENFAGPTHSKSGWLSRRPPSKKKKKERSRCSAALPRALANVNTRRTCACPPLCCPPFPNPFLCVKLFLTHTQNSLCAFTTRFLQSQPRYIFPPPLPPLPPQDAQEGSFKQRAHALWGES
jgi:hypothetical protein